MSEPPLCVVERWPPLAPVSGGDRDQPGPNSQRRCPAPRIPSCASGPDPLTGAGQRDGRPRLYTDTPAPLGVPVPGAASPRAGSGSPGTSPAACAPHLSPASGSGSRPPPPGASSSRSSSPPLPSPAEHAQPGTRIAGSEAGGRDPPRRQPRSRCAPSRPRLSPTASRRPRRTFPSCRG